MLDLFLLSAAVAFLARVIYTMETHWRPYM